jgi:integrase
MSTTTERKNKDGTTSYQVEIRRRGYPPLRKTFRTLADARNWSVLTEASVLKNETINPREAAQWTIPEIIEWYKENPNPERKLETRKHFQRLDLLSEEFKHFTAISLTPAILSKWIKKRLEINAQATVYHYYVALKNAMTYHAIQHGYSQAIFTMVTCPSTSGVRSQRFSIDETADLFRATNKRAKTKKPEFMLSVLFALETAMRIGEQLKLKWSDINLKDCYADIQAANTKTKTHRRIPLTSKAVKILKYIKSKYGDKKTDRVFSFYHNNEHHLSRQFKIVCGWANIDDRRWHDLRHEATSRFFEKTTLTDIEVAHITGHKTMSMLLRYSHLRPSTILPKLW